MKILHKIIFITFFISSTIKAQEVYMKYNFDEPVNGLSNVDYRIMAFGPSTVNYSKVPLLKNTESPLVSVSPLGTEALIRMDNELGVFSLIDFDFEIKDKLKSKEDPIIHIEAGEFGAVYYLLFKSGKIASVKKVKNDLNIYNFPLDFFVSKMAWNNNLKKLLVADDYYLFYLDPKNGEITDRVKFNSEITTLSFDLNTYEVFVGLSNGKISSWKQDLSKMNYEISLGNSGITSIQPDPLDHYLYAGTEEGTIVTINRLKHNTFNTKNIFNGSVILGTVYDKRINKKFVLGVGGDKFLQIFDNSNLEPNYQRIVKEKVTIKKEKFLKFKQGETAVEYDNRVSSNNINKFLENISHSIVDSLAKTKSDLIPEFVIEKDTLKVTIRPFKEVKIKLLRDVTSVSDLKMENVQFNLNQDNTFSIRDLHLKNITRDIRYSSDIRTMRFYEEAVEIELAKEIAQKEVQFKENLTDIVQKLRAKGKLSDVDLSVESVLKKEKDSLGNEELNLHIAFMSQGIKAEVEKQTADFPPGKYNLFDSEAATSLVGFFIKSTSEKLQEYLKPNTRITFKITGSTDKSKVLGVIPYEGEYGDFNNFPYYFQGDLSGLKLSQESGITNNSQLGFLRTYSVKNFIENNTEIFDLTKKKYIHYSEEADAYGPEYRKIKIEMIIHQIDKIVSPEKNDNKPRGLSDVDIHIPQGPNTKAYAIVIGNEDYSSFQKDLSKESDVPYAVRDAETFYNYLIQMYQIPRENIDLLKNATFGEISQHISKLERLMDLDGQDSEIIVYYSGHGMPDEITKDPYLIPVDISGLNVNQGISLKDFMKRIGNKPHKKISFVIDACFSGLGKSKPLSEIKGITVVPVNPELSDQMVLLSSSSSNESSVVDDDNQHGLFTYHLLKILKETEGSITIENLYSRLSKEVGLSAIKKHNKIQTPSILLGSKIKPEQTSIKLIGN